MNSLAHRVVEKQHVIDRLTSDKAALENRMRSIQDELRELRAFHGDIGGDVDYLEDGGGWSGIDSHR